MHEKGRDAARERRRKLQDLRREYEGDRLSAEDLPPSPMTLFESWFEQALEACTEPNAMVLSTVGDSGPSSRLVLLKGVDASGFTFYTNYDSRKAKEIAGRPAAALNFFWIELHRQVRVEGRVRKASEEVSDQYFAARPRGSQLGAWASPQSAEISGRQTLEERLKTMEQRFQDQDVVPRPPRWGGFTLEPTAIEFWQGQESRLHDRALYRRAESGWERVRLAP